jgi:hypothetical protein
LHTSTPDVELVDGGDPSEVLRLGEGMRLLGPSQFGREGEDAEITEEGNDGGASAQIRRGQRHFGALDRCTGFAERGGRGAGELRCRTRPRNGRERRRASAAFNKKKKGKGEGSGMGGATWRKEEGVPIERDMEGRRTGPDVLQRRGSSRDGRWSSGVQRRVEEAERAARVGYA